MNYEWSIDNGQMGLANNNIEGKQFIITIR